MTRVTKTWLIFNDSTCVRCKRFCGPEGEIVYLIEGEGLVCDACYENYCEVCGHSYGPDDKCLKH